MQLTFIDLVVIALYFLFNLAIGLYLRKRATGSVDDFFVSGRNVTWWLAGTSMVATTFAADTPLVVTGLVARNGIAGNWIWWSFLFSGMLTVFFFAKLWRRSEVLTDVEFVEIRYSGKPAKFLRIFRAVYLGLPINLIIIGWVNLAMVKIFMLVLGVGKFEALMFVLLVMVITAFITTLSGLWGVLWTDLFQFVLKMSLIIVLAFFAISKEGGMTSLVVKLKNLEIASGGTKQFLNFVPDWNSIWMPLIAFLVYVGVNWWSSWYPGAEPGGGGYVAQRIFSAKDEKHSILATFWFNIAHYALRPWPWILVALVAVVRYSGDASFIKDPESGYIRIMLADLPVYLRGLMIAGFLAAYMSTVATQLNWGASYIINDVYKRFKPKAEQKHYVNISQIMTVVMMLLSCVVTFYMESIAGAWKFLMALGAGTGLVYILRWYWWRVNAWSEISAMIAAFVTSVFFQFGLHFKEEDPTQFSYMILGTVAVTTVVWLIVTYLTKPEPMSLLKTFYEKVRPNATFWKPVAKECPNIEPVYDGMFNLLNWILGIVCIYSLLFGVGYILFTQILKGFILTIIGIIALFLLYRRLDKKGWESLSK